MSEQAAERTDAQGVQVDSIPSHRSDELPRYIEINRLKFRVHAETLTGRELRDLPIPSIGDTDDLWRVDNSSGDRLVRESDVEDLRGGRFYSAPRFINAGAPRVVLQAGQAAEQAHGIEACFNNGWDGDPAWKVICECAWEAWDYPTEASVRCSHAFHVAKEVADRQEVSEPSSDEQAGSQLVARTGEESPRTTPDGSLTSEQAHGQDGTDEKDFGEQQSCSCDGSGSAS